MRPETEAERIKRKYREVQDANARAARENSYYCAGMPYSSSDSDIPSFISDCFSSSDSSCDSGSSDSGSCGD